MQEADPQQYPGQMATPIQCGEGRRSKCWAHGDQLTNQVRCAILAAGLGKRLEPLTLRYIPKPLFPLGGKVSIVETWIHKMVESGITDLSMNLCVLKETIKREFTDGVRFGASINYVEEDVPSGTLGGVCKQVLGRDAKMLPGDSPLDIEPFLGDTIIAPSGDIVTNVGPGELQELYEIHKRVGASFTMVLVPIPMERRKDFGTAVLNAPKHRNGVLSQGGRIEKFFEKDPNSPSNLNNASIYLIEARLLKELDPIRTEARLGLEEPFYDFGQHVFPALLGKLPYLNLSSDNLLWGARYDGQWFDVGQKRDYLCVNEYVLDGALDVNLPFEKLPWGYLGRDVAVDFAHVKIIPPVVIGNQCTIEAGTQLGPYAVIGDDWIIERDAKISHSVLWERYPMFRDDGVELPPSQRLLIDRHVVQEGVTIEGCIVAGGSIEKDYRDSTVEVLDDGSVVASHIDYQPDGKRV